MMWPLFKKELRHLLPLATLVCAFTCANLLYVPLTERLDETTWMGEEVGDAEEAGALGFVLLLLALMAAFSLFPREHDEGTMSFLYSLPARRRHIFGAKVLAAASILFFGLLIGHVVDWLLTLPNTQSFAREQFCMRTAAGVLLVQTAYCLIVLSHCVLLSFFRTFGLILYGIVWWFLLTLDEIDPSLGFLVLSDMLFMQFRGTELIIPWRMIGMHGAVGLVCLTVASAMWMGPSEQFSNFYSHARNRVIVKILLWGGIVGLVILGVVLLGPPDDVEETEPVQYVWFSSARLDTEHYQFVYPSNLRDRALQVANAADATYTHVRGVLGATNDLKIVADLTESSAEHAGIASWKKLRMDIQDEKDRQGRLHVLCHETTHIFAYAESDKRIQDHSESTLFFNEGLAEYTAFRFVESPTDVAESRRIAAASWERHDIKFEDLCRVGALKKTYDENLVYTLGLVWVEALVDVHGSNAVGRVLRAMGREDAPSSIDEGVAFWQDTLQAAGMEIEGVVDGWEQRLEKVTEQEREHIDQIPRLSGGVAYRSSEMLGLVAHVDAERYDEGHRYLLRIRDDATDEETAVRTLRPVSVKKPDSDSGDSIRIRFRVPRRSLSRQKFMFQFGVQPSGYAWPFYETWQWGTVKGRLP